MTKLSEMTDKQIAGRIFTHLETQGGPAMNTKQFQCMYRAPDGKRNAFGWHTKGAGVLREEYAGSFDEDGAFVQAPHEAF